MIMEDPEKNILKNLDQDNKKRCRRWMIANILATDMKEHFELLSTFKDSIQSQESFGKKEEELVQITRYALHACDLNGPARKGEIAEKWSRLVNLEFTAQVEAEGRLGIPQTEYFKNLDQEDVFYKGEIGFISFIVLPTWDLFNIYLNNEISHIIENLKNNRAHYEKCKARAEEAKFACPIVEEEDESKKP